MMWGPTQPPFKRSVPLHCTTTTGRPPLVPPSLIALSNRYSLICFYNTEICPLNRNSEVEMPSTSPKGKAEARLKAKRERAKAGDKVENVPLTKRIRPLFHRSLALLPIPRTHLLPPTIGNADGNPTLLLPSLCHRLPPLLNRFSIAISMAGALPTVASLARNFSVSATKPNFKLVAPPAPTLTRMSQLNPLTNPGIMDTWKAVLFAFHLCHIRGCTPSPPRMIFNHHKYHPTKSYLLLHLLQPHHACTLSCTSHHNSPPPAVLPPRHLMFTLTYPASSYCLPSKFSNEPTTQQRLDALQLELIEANARVNALTQRTNNANSTNAPPPPLNPNAHPKTQTNPTTTQSPT
jgi:hypothetical protein